MKGLKDITDGLRSHKETIDDYVRLTLKRVVATDEGTYCILVKNRYGCDRSFFSIKVNLILIRCIWIFSIDVCTFIMIVCFRWNNVPGHWHPTGVLWAAAPRPEVFLVCPARAVTRNSLTWGVSICSVLIWKWGKGN